ncbi:radical SAM/SPASM domain-containing protein [Helicobacter mustelae]|nr:radical SAM/SPASM domain-containing protein [Helicobacter mustelae]
MRIFRKIVMIFMDGSLLTKAIIPQSMDLGLRFKKVYIEISDICGLNCSFCPQQKGVRGKMSLLLFEKILSQIQGKTKLVSLHVLGDPCKHTDLSSYLDLLTKYALRADIVTSGYYLCQELLFEPCIHQVAFSLDAGLDPKNPHKKDYLAKILEFCALHQMRQSKIFLNLRLQDRLLNPAVLEQIVRFFGVQIKEPHVYGRYKLREYIFLVITKSFTWADMSLKKSCDSRRCHAIKEQIAILANGIVVPCCIDAAGVIALGDVNVQSLQEIYHSPRSVAIKEGFEKGIAIEELCKKCNFPTNRVASPPVRLLSPNFSHKSY